MGLLLFFFSYGLGLLSLKVEGNMTLYALAMVAFTFICMRIPYEKFRYFVIHPLILSIISSVIIQFLGVVSLHNPKELFMLIVFFNLVLYAKQREEKRETNETNESQAMEIITERIFFPIFLPLSFSFISLFLFQNEQDVFFIFMLSYFASITYMLVGKLTFIYSFAFVAVQIGLLCYVSTFMPGFGIKEIIFIFVNIVIFITTKQGRKMPLSFMRSKHT